MAETLFYVRRSFPFYAGIPADTGAVFPLGGHPGDEKLVRLGFLEKVEGKPQLAKCGECGTSFLSARYREAHGDRRHVATDIPPVAEGLSPLEGMASYSYSGIEGAVIPDLTGDAEERRLEREAPLYLEKTTASQRG